MSARRWFAVVLFCAVSAAPALAADAPTAKDLQAVEDKAHKYADIAWVLTASAMVMVMVPGLALFYGGMARRKNILATMMQSMVCLGLVGVQWVAVGYSFAFGESKAHMVLASDADGQPVKASLFGYSPELVGLRESAAAAPGGKFATFPNTRLPLYLHAMFQGMFAIITVALISGAFAERVKFGTYLLFALLWTTIVYDPIAHWIWSVEWSKPDGAGTFAAAGLFGANGAIDFAGGTAVHIAAGFAGLAAVLVLRKRIGFGKQSFHPSSMVITLLGAGLLWFGWFGFNAGSALAANGQAASTFAVTQIAAAIAGLTWLGIEWCHRGKPTALGFASGLVAGLVAITPASGFVAPGGALVIGALAGALCYGTVLLKSALGYDDSLDAFGIHGVGGFLGAVLTGAFVSLPLWMAGTESEAKLFPGRLNAAKDAVDVASQLNWQVAAAVVCAAYSFVVTAGLVYVLDRTLGFAVKPAEEEAGLDLSQHGETGFDLGPDVNAGAVVEPKSATMPPAQRQAVTGDRFTVVLEGADPARIRETWAAMCKPRNGTPPAREFAEVYKHLTTIRGNRFRFRGGDPTDIKRSLVVLFGDALDQSVRAHVEH